MKNINIKLITDFELAHKLWDSFSPNDTYGNTWEFRAIYNRIRNFPINFYAAYENDLPVALLPLEFSHEKNSLIFFGGTYFEDNSLFVKNGYEKIIPNLLSKVEKPVRLGWMINDLENYQGVGIVDYRYELPIEGLTSYDDYIEKYWHGKSKKKLKRRINELLNDGMEIEYDNLDNLQYMIDLNHKRFGDNSTLIHLHRSDYLKKVIELFEVHSITIKIHGKIESVGMALKYKDSYIGLNSGTNSEIDSLGKLLTLLKIQQAIDLKTKVYDTRGGNLGWKERFGLKAVPQYELDLKNDK